METVMLAILIHAKMGSCYDSFADVSASNNEVKSDDDVPWEEFQ